MFKFTSLYIYISKSMCKIIHAINNNEYKSQYIVSLYNIYSYRYTKILVAIYYQL